MDGPGNPLRKDQAIPITEEEKITTLVIMIELYRKPSWVQNRNQTTPLCREIDFVLIFNLILDLEMSSVSHPSVP